ncbi:MAG: SocA family protein [Acetobacteraceae bacterium]|nr:SocA family protein [Acetobacteraceae bacterium]
MDKLRALLLFFIEKFPRPLNRTELVKLVYLTDVQHYKVCGRSLTGLTFRRGLYGPYCEEIPRAIRALGSEGLIGIEEWKNIHGGITYIHSLLPQGTHDLWQLGIDEERAAYFVLAQTQHLSFTAIKDRCVMRWLRRQLQAGPPWGRC